MISKEASTLGEVEAVRNSQIKTVSRQPTDWQNRRKRPQCTSVFRHLSRSDAVVNINSRIVAGSVV